MIKYFLLLIAGTAISTALCAQFDWAAQTSGTTQPLTDLCFISKNNGWAVGAGGVILHTTDRGNSWTAQVSGTTTELSAVYFLDENNGWAAGGDFVMGSPVVLHTTNGGQTWSPQTFTASDAVSDILFTSLSNGFAVTTFGLYKTTNGGTSWQSQNSGFGGQHFCIDFAGTSNGWIGCAVGTVLRTVNGGTSWSVIDAGTISNVYAIDFVDANTGWFCTSGGEIFKTTNGGLSWQAQETFTTSLLFDIQFSDANHGYAVGLNGLFLYTSDGGNNWNQASTGTSQTLFAVVFHDLLNGWVAGNGGNIRCTTEEEKVCLVTVDTVTGKNLVIWEKTPGRQTVSYNIYKRIGASYLIAGNVPYNDMSTYLDVLSSPEVTADRYAIRAVDNEGVESRISPYHQTVNLGVSVGVPATNITLNWSHYTDESGEFMPDYYYIYRSTNPSNFALYDSVSSAFTSYNDLNVTVPYYYKIAVSKSTDCLPSSSKEVISYRKAYSNSDQGVQGIHDTGNRTPVGLSPNPGKDKVSVDLGQKESVVEYSVCDGCGKSRLYGIENNVETFHLNTSELAPGLYYLRLKCSHRVIQTPLIIE